MLGSVTNLIFKERVVSPSPLPCYVGISKIICVSQCQLFCIKIRSLNSIYTLVCVVYVNNWKEIMTQF